MDKAACRDGALHRVDEDDLVMPPPAHRVAVLPRDDEWPDNRVDAVLLIEFPRQRLLASSPSSMVPPGSRNKEWSAAYCTRSESPTTQSPNPLTVTMT